MLAYKVVEKNTRHCSNWAIFKHHTKYWDKHCYRYDPRKFKKDNIQFFPRYLKGTIVKEAKGSIGIMCFETLVSAKIFLSSYGFNGKIIKVNGRNKKKKRHIFKYCGSSPENLFKSSLKVPAPEGTVVFKSVEVLE